MAQEYQPKRFFRHAPNRLLNRYFSEHRVLAEVDFAKLTETQVEPIYEAWLKLPEDTRNDMERDFQEVDDLAAEGGTKAILDEARFHDEDLAEQFAKLKGFHERALWTLLERPKYWPGAVYFHRADSVPDSYWRRRKNVPRKPANYDQSSAEVRKLEQDLGNYFFTMQGRGNRNCKVECYRRGDLDCFFAYPEDYAQASVEWAGKKFTRRVHHPAFEIIFVYSQAEGTLDVYLAGDRKPVADLQAIFAQAILKAELGPDEKDERVYELGRLRARNFQFNYAPESGITDVAVCRMRMKIHGKKEHIALDADPSYNKLAIFDLLDKVTKGIPVAQMALNKVGFKVTFAHTPGARRQPTRTFDISWPNSCNLKHDGRDLIIRKMLADSDIEPREPSLPDRAT
jgi:hypothetical protein